MTATIVLNLTYLVLVSSTFTRTAIWLRLFVCVGSVGFITFGVMTDVPSMVIWNALIGSMHIVAVARILRRRRETTAGPQADWIRRVVFADLEPALFNLLWTASWAAEYDDHTLTVQGTAHDRLAIVLSGVVDVRIDGVLINRLGPGAMIGEMSMMSGSVATADTRAAGPVVLREWNRAELLALGDAEAAIGRSVEQAALRSIIYKTQVGVSPAAAG